MHIDFRLDLAALGPDGVRHLFDELRSLQREASDQPDGFRLEEIIIALVDSPNAYCTPSQIARQDSESLVVPSQLLSAESDIRRQIAGEHLWCLALILQAFFDDPTDFPHLRAFDIQARWPETLSAGLGKIAGDPRLHEVQL